MFTGTELVAMTIGLALGFGVIVALIVKRKFPIFSRDIGFGIGIIACVLFTIMFAFIISGPMSDGFSGHKAFLDLDGNVVKIHNMQAGINFWAWSPFLEKIKNGEIVILDIEPQRTFFTSYYRSETLGYLVDYVPHQDSSSLNQQHKILSESEQTLYEYVMSCIQEHIVYSEDPKSVESFKVFMENELRKVGVSVDYINIEEVKISH